MSIDRYLGRCWCYAYLPFTPLAALLGFGEMPAMFFVILGMIVVLYMVMAEAAKRIFYKVVKF